MHRSSSRKRGPSREFALDSRFRGNERSRWNRFAVFLPPSITYLCGSPTETDRMTWNPALAPSPDEVSPDTIETVILARTRDLGGFEVRRALPAPGRQMVGPFIFFDQAGPAEFV